jgi:hypothetical protein
MQPATPAVPTESPDFHKLVKKNCWKYCLRFVPLETPMLVVAVTAHVPLRHVVGYARLSRGAVVQ